MELQFVRLFWNLAQFKKKCYYPEFNECRVLCLPFLLLTLLLVTSFWISMKYQRGSKKKAAS